MRKTIPQLTSRARLVLVAAALLVFLLPLAAKLHHASSATHTVTLTKDGFSPSTMTIEEGDTVEFITTAPDAFWPASDPHPVHDLYSAFDPREPVPASASWSFTFDKAGTWPYHNHLDPSEHGVIVVHVAGTSTAPSEPPCSYAQASTDERCFEELVRSAIEQKGIDAGWKVFTDLYDSGHAPASCHWTAHLIGEEAFLQFKAGKTVPLSTATTYCGYGFYHGFMSKLLHDDPDPKLAISFCDEVRKQLGIAAQNNCFHGIGHGFTPETVLPDQFGNVSALLQMPLGICQKLFRDQPLTESICDSGAFDVLGDYMSEGQFGFTLNRTDPLGMCFTLDAKYFVTCYIEMAPKLDSITNWDPSKIPHYMERVTDERERQDIVRIALGTMMQRDVVRTNWDDYLRSCRTLSEDLQPSCISGLVWGLIMHGEPQKEAEKPLLLCESGLLSGKERQECYEDLGHWLGLIYSPERVASFCTASVPSSYAGDCATGGTLRL